MVHADTGGLSRLTASSSSFAATVAPSVRISPATALARARVAGFRAVLSAADRASKVGVGPSCAAPMPSSATRAAQYGWSAIWGTADREPWLRAVGDWLAACGAAGVVSCSALKRPYRDGLRERGRGVWFLHLDGPPDVAAARVGGREAHFMPVSLVTAQYAALEPLADDEPGLTVEFVLPPEQIVERALRALATTKVATPFDVMPAWKP
ncbi:gluconokinase [Microtetraspora malaysiensis]|uniref:gluconokinase n=1 Tax=Microtetraspora malaysiensis TaxID=161358 RepID=UPI003D8F87C4